MIYLLRTFQPKEQTMSELHGISKSELEGIVKRAVTSVLEERKDLLEEAVSEAILDMKLGLAIEEGDRGDYVSEENIMKKLLS